MHKKSENIGEGEYNTLSFINRYHAPYIFKISGG